MKPPDLPWKEIAIGVPPAGYLSFYIADRLSALPVRAVTLPGNQKSDPNLETATFGLFSTCERLMRAGIVRHGLAYLFFVTNYQRRGRIVTGYYRLKWCFEHSKGDWALAADRQRFVWPPIEPNHLPVELRSKVFSRFRGYRRLDSDDTAALLARLNRRADATSEYVSEIARLERFNLRHTGYRIWRNRDPFTWDSAKQYIPSKTAPLAESNTSTTNQWECSECDAVIYNVALLRACPQCQRIGTLRPIKEET